MRWRRCRTSQRYTSRSPALDCRPDAIMMPLCLPLNAVLVTQSSWCTSARAVAAVCKHKDFMIHKPRDRVAHWQAPASVPRTGRNRASLLREPVIGSQSAEPAQVDVLSHII